MNTTEYGIADLVPATLGTIVTGDTVHVTDFRDPRLNRLAWRVGPISRDTDAAGDEVRSATLYALCDTDGIPLACTVRTVGPPSRELFRCTARPRP